MHCNKNNIFVSPLKLDIDYLEIPGKDRQGNPINSDGSYKVERVDSVANLTDADFLRPCRNVILPKISDALQKAFGTEKEILIKKNIFEKKLRSHKDLSADDGKRILQDALYETTVVARNHPVQKPNYWICIKENPEKNSAAVIDIDGKKKYAEIVGWRKIDKYGVEKVKRRARREGEQVLILTSK